MDAKGQAAKFEYRLTYQKKNSSMNMSAKALGYIGPYTARGNCVIKKS